MRARPCVRAPHDQTVPEDRGVFLEHTWRMRPEVNAFVSEAFYESRLSPSPELPARSIADGNGVRFLAVEHEGRSQASPEEADAVRAEIERLVGTPYVQDGVERSSATATSSWWRRTTRMCGA